MRRSHLSVWTAGLWVFALTTLGAVAGQRIGVGPEYDIVTGDCDNGAGAYATYQLDLNGPICAFADA